MRIAYWGIPFVATILLLTACGRDAQFDGKKSSRGDSHADSEGTLKTPDDGDVTPDDALPPPATVSLDNVDPKDQDYVRGCLDQWKNVDFGANAAVKALNAQVSVGGSGYAIDDPDITDGPAVILVKAAINVLGQPIYRLGNPHGYYCIKANVNVLTGLEVDVACQAHLASNKVGVNVGSQTDGPIAGIGVDVLSTIRVKSYAPDGYTCDGAAN